MAGNKWTQVFGRISYNRISNLDKEDRRKAVKGYRKERARHNIFTLEFFRDNPNPRDPVNPHSKIGRGLRHWIAVLKTLDEDDN